MAKDPGACRGWWGKAVQGTCHSVACTLVAWPPLHRSCLVSCVQLMCSVCLSRCADVQTLLLCCFHAVVRCCALQDHLAWSEELFYVFNYDKPIGAAADQQLAHPHSVAFGMKVNCRDSCCSTCRWQHANMHLLLPVCVPCPWLC